MIVLDSAKPVTHKFLIERELSNFGIRLNEDPPQITIKRKDRGGIDIQEIVPQTKGLTKDIATRILKEYKMSCVTVTLREDCTIDRFIDAVDGKRTYIPALYVMNKIDQLTIEELDIIDQMPNYVVSIVRLCASFVTSGRSRFRHATSGISMNSWNPFGPNATCCAFIRSRRASM